MGRLPDLDEVAALKDGTLENVVKKYLKAESTKIITDLTARRLVATPFYFELSASFITGENGTSEVQGKSSFQIPILLL